MTIACVVGARPNFMKMGPIVQALHSRDLETSFVHTGQHYDSNMSQVFVEELGLPAPDVNLGVGSGSHAAQTAAIMIGLEQLWLHERPRLVIVAGDINSTMAAALVAAKLSIPIAHVEAGLRSFDRTMPEEINRIVTDTLSDLLFTSEDASTRQLLAEGIARDKIHFVGNCMIDSLERQLPAALAAEPWRRFRCEPARYGLVTLHRPANVDDAAAFARTLEMLGEIARHLPLIFPVHPRTRARLADREIPNVALVDPQPYLTFLGLMARAAVVLTDSGGVQDETTALGVPCVTMRDNTERPITVTLGTNVLAGTKPDRVRDVVLEQLERPARRREVPPLWDGSAAHRIVDVVMRWLPDH
ncbi:MAG: UDP-N-acetylglucosamine 2-epimerase (non-hydrolyzing) [Kofleriaceae bacterium]|nr:UDP-N-acetylglucosamine 2-epimerase (non-hydrolyzing) [Kofleriaceae bacterium]